MTNAMCFKALRDVMACTVLALLGCPAQPAALSVTILQADGRPLTGAVVVAESKLAYPVRTNVKAIMDQRDLMFVPEVLLIRTGTAVEFPNSDQVRHQVYSFSGAKTFQLPLYAGKTQPPVVFDRAGIVTVGCNIHDAMIAYIFVTDSPWHGRSNDKGTLQLADLAAGNYLVKIWHPRMNEGRQLIEQAVTLSDNADGSVKIQLRKALRGAVHHHTTGKQWQDY